MISSMSLVMWKRSGATNSTTRELLRPPKSDSMRARNDFASSCARIALVMNSAAFSLVAAGIALPPALLAPALLEAVAVFVLTLLVEGAAQLAQASRKQKGAASFRF